MSDNLNSILDGLETSTNNIKVNIDDDKEDISIEEAKVQKAIDKQTAKIKKTKKDIDEKKISKTDAQRRVVRYKKNINKLKKQAGKASINMNTISKAKPRPANTNSNDVRCFIRYNNQGNPYRICSNQESSGGFKSPPAQITAPIPISEFLDKLGKTYGELTDGQQREYHRLDMANRRFEEREKQAPARDALDEVLREQRRLGGFIVQQNKLDEVIEIKENKQKLNSKLNDISKKYRELFKANKVKGEVISKLSTKRKEDFEKKAGFTKEFKEELKKAGIAPEIKRKLRIINKGDVASLKEKKKKVSKNIKEVKEDIVDNQEKVETVLKKKVLMSFD